jgi:di/tricarboxylate transporter
VTLPQILSLSTLAATMAMFVWGRFRYDVIAILALLASLAIGIVKPKDAFSGFSDDIVIIVGSALVVSAAVQRSGLVERLVIWIAGRATRVRSQLLVLTASVALASSFVKNIGALAMLMPAAFQLAKRRVTSPSVFLMPMSFASLLGGLLTLIGTSPNIIVSKVREELTGEPFRMFDFLPTGLGLLVVGLIFLRFGYRLLPRDRQAQASLADAMGHQYSTEATVNAGSKVTGETIADFEARFEGGAEVISVLRAGVRGDAYPAMTVCEDDVLIIAGSPEVLHQVLVRANLTLEGDDREAPEAHRGEEIGIVEGVIVANSILVGRTASRLQLQTRFGINLIAVSRQGAALKHRVGGTVLRAGDVIVLQGPETLLPGRLENLGVLPLAERKLQMGERRNPYLPLAILVVAMVGAASGLVPVSVAFFAAAGLCLVTGALPLREGYAALEGPILIMLAALIPVSESLRTTGASDVIARELANLAAGLPPWGAIALILVAAMAITPFLNNAATVLVMAPIAGVFAHDLGYRPEAFLIATAIGAGCDFLTPFGHQCNTLVLGPGAYRFSDYARLGAPLSLLVVLIAPPLVLWVWPL